MKAEDILKPENRDRIVMAIEAAEKNTSGEIRVHVESFCKGDQYLRAAYVFSKLGMFKTQNRNAVLIYIAVKSHKFAIIGDSGINERTGAGFWNDIKDGMESAFRAGEFTDGIAGAIAGIGEKLKSYFPYASDDVNELSNDISYGEE